MNALAVLALVLAYLVALYVPSPITVTLAAVVGLIAARVLIRDLLPAHRDREPGDQ